MNTADSHLTFSWAILVESNRGPFICQHCDLLQLHSNLHYPVRVGSARISESTMPASSKLLSKFKARAPLLCALQFYTARYVVFQKGFTT